MDLFAIDDSRQRKPTRDGVRPLVSVGGIHVEGHKVRELRASLDALCTEFGFPSGEEFKWSPGRETWEWKNLHGSRRDDF